MKKTIYSLFALALIALAVSSCKDGDFGGDYDVQGVKLEKMCGTWVCSADSYDPWFTMLYYNGNDGYTPEFINSALGDPYGVASPDANGDGIVDEKDFELYTADDMWVNEYGEYPEIITSNTAANTDTEMLITDPFWDEVYKVKVDPKTMTFSAGEIVDDTYTPLMVNPVDIPRTYANDGAPVVLGGKVLKGAATAPGSGMKTDSIVFYVKYADDYGQDMYYRMSGYLKTGYTEDN